MKIEEYKKEFENMTYDELDMIYQIIRPIKKEKYKKSDTYKKQRLEANRRYISSKNGRIKRRGQTQRWRNKHREKVRKYDMEMYRKKRREEIEKTIALSDKVATKHANTSCVFDVSQLWNTYELDNR